MKDINAASPFYKEVNDRKDFLNELPIGGIGAEVGVFKGEFSKNILEIAKPKKLHLIDVWWEVYGEKFPDWGAYTKFGNLKTREAYDEVLENTKNHLDKCEIHVGKSEDFLPLFDDNYFDWVYLDSAHNYDTVKAELAIVVDKVKEEGIISGHDYWPDKDFRHYGVCVAVTEFCKNSEWNLVYHDNWFNWYLKR